MSGNTNTEPAHDDAPDVDIESLALQLAIDSHANINRDGHSAYLEGRRDAYLRMAAAVEGHHDPALGRVVTQLRIALTEGVAEVDALRGVVAHSTGRPRTLSHGLDWIGPRAFDARHGDRGLDEDFGMRWGSKHDVRISFKRYPGADEGLLYAYDKTWDTYAVIATKTSRNLVQLAYRQALAANPDMTAETFAGYHRIVTATARTSAVARAVSL